MRISIAAILVLTSMCATAGTREIPAAGLSTNDIVAWLHDWGYRTEVVANHDGSTHVKTYYEGMNFGVYMLDCKEGTCGSVQFSAGWATHGKFDTSQMNRWDRDHRWCRGYFDSTNDPWVEMDVDLTPGGSYELLTDQLKIFEDCIDSFRRMYQL